MEIKILRITPERRKVVRTELLAGKQYLHSYVQHTVRFAFIPLFVLLLYVITILLPLTYVWKMQIYLTTAHWCFDSHSHRYTHTWQKTQYLFCCCCCSCFCPFIYVKSINFSQIFYFWFHITFLLSFLLFLFSFCCLYRR